MHFIFDLDHTVIDSSHRQLTRNDGSLDLDHWRENCTRAAIMRDSLLPLASIMQAAILDNQHVIICTARVLSHYDLEYLTRHGLLVSDILSRPEGDNSKDDVLKVRLLQEFANEQGMAWHGFCRRSVMWDDNENVLRTLKKHGITMQNAVKTNKLIKAV